MTLKSSYAVFQKLYINYITSFNNLTSLTLMHALPCTTLTRENLQVNESSLENMKGIFSMKNVSSPASLVIVDLPGLLT